MYNNLEQKRQEKARKDYFEQGIEDLEVFRPEIYDSWKRSLKHNLNLNKPVIHVLNDDQLKTLCLTNQLLLEVAVPFMELLYDTVKGSGFVIMLADKDGYILKIVGDENILSDLQNRTSPLVEGSNRHEDIYGTCGVGTPITIRRPIQLTSIEHFHRESNPVSGTGAPLIDFNGNLLGALSMSDSSDKVQSHTLGMVTAASRSIVEQLSLQQLNNQLIITKNQLQTILDTFDYGVFLINADSMIVDANAAASKVLDYKKDDIIGSPITSFINKIDFADIKSDVYDIEMPIKARNKSENFFVTIRAVEHSLASNKMQLLIIFKEAFHIHKLVNKYIGSSAYFTFDDIIGDSFALNSTKEFAKIAAHNTSNVLITGESGTGKELFAQSIHNSSKFADGPFISVNCGAIPKSLVESELFGYEGGSFTGAKKNGNAGKFELANNGTIFLDEIGDMPYEVQVHLLRILQTKAVTRLGGKKSIPLNFRVIAATNVNLENSISEKTFRSDLFYRLNVLSFRIPPLRERGNDIFILTNYFIKKLQQSNRPLIEGISPNVEHLFKKYSWPGNIRELENTIERACLLTHGNCITREYLQQSILKIDDASLPANDRTTVEQSFKTISLNQDDSIVDAEKAIIINHLLTLNGNINKTAESLDMSRSTLYRKLKKYSIDYNGMR